MPRYAQIDTETGRAISVSLLAGEVEADHMIPLEEATDVLPGDIYADGEWTRPEPTPEPGPTPAERITALEAENAGMALELAMNQIRFDQMEQANADLLFALVDKGVL